ncbi:hypothetical protein ABPG72_017187 [Tetrahymena utriculariae]
MHRRYNTTSVDFEKVNLFYDKMSQGIISIQIIMLFIISEVLNSQINLSSMILYTLFGLLLIDFKQDLTYLIKNIKHGPLIRTININGDQIKDLTEDQIFTEYYNFTNQQKYIEVKIKNFNSELLFKVALQLIKCDKIIKIVTLQQDIFLFSKNLKSIKFSIKQMWFAQGCFDILNCLRPFCLNIQIKFQPNIESLISSFIFQNFDLIPLLQIHLNDNFYMELINKVQAETLRFIGYNKMQAIEMTLNPEEVYYDLFDD